MSSSSLTVLRCGKRRTYRVSELVHVIHHPRNYISTHGKGATVTVVRVAKSAVSPTVPSRLYMATANSGNAAANAHRKALLLAVAEAEMGRYAVTRYVNVDAKEK